MMQTYLMAIVTAGLFLVGWRVIELVKGRKERKKR
jgi:hypothetical protein